MTTRRLAAIALVVSLLLAGVLSWYASGSPDGLEHVAETKGFDHTAQEHAAAGGPLADYETKGVEGRLSTGLAGVIGVVATGLVMGGLIVVLRRRGGSTPTELAEPPEQSNVDRVDRT